MMGYYAGLVVAGVFLGTQILGCAEKFSVRAPQDTTPTIQAGENKKEADAFGAKHGTEISAYCDGNNRVYLYEGCVTVIQDDKHCILEGIKGQEQLSRSKRLWRISED